jgi:hypothetical protein
MPHGFLPFGHEIWFAAAYYCEAFAGHLRKARPSEGAVVGA